MTENYKIEIHGNSFASNVITLQAKTTYFACNVFHNFTLTLQAKPPYFACNVAYFGTFPLKCSQSEIPEKFIGGP